MNHNGLLGAAALLLSAATTFAQLDLSALYTRTVKAGQPFATIDTKVNSLSLEVQVDRGVVTTLATFEYTPGKGAVSQYVCQPEVCSAIKCPASDCQYRVVQDLVLDSLETTAGFSLSDNSVLTDMYLWVGDAKVKADLQERALASAQYEDIVKRRRDPALIETWGNGYYNLRIFPNESGKSRKLQVEIVQGMEDEGTTFQVLLPILHRLAKIASAGAVDYASLPNRTIASVSLAARSLDGRTYKLAWEGLGSGEIGATPLRLEAKDVAELKTGLLTGSASACAGCLTPWTAEKAGEGYFGVKTSLIAKQIKFQAEPEDRHFLLDVDGKDTLVAARARKVALLSLKAYASGTTHHANLALADGKGGLAWVFPQPVGMDADNLRKAYEALKAWKPNPDANAHATLRAYARSRGAASASASPSLAYLINNDTTPYYNWAYGPDGTLKGGSQAGYEAWEKAQSALEDETLDALKAAHSMLFGFWNDYRLNRIAAATGGFQVGSLYGYVYYPMAGGIATDFAGDKIAPIADIHLPPLFGPGRPDAWSISDLDVKASGLSVEQLVVLQTQRQWGWYELTPMGGGVVARDALLPYQRPSLDTVLLRLSGRYQGNGPVTLAVSGIWGGLRFSQQFTADLPASGGAGPLGAGIWAYQQTEAWGRTMAKIGLDAYRALGRDYHIVNRQMSLLALEPGVPLWTEMPAKDGGTAVGGRELTAGVPASDSKMGAGGQSTASLDKASLEDILTGTVGVKGPVAAQVGGAGGLALRRLGPAVSLIWDLPGAGSGGATFRILDLSGKAVAEIAATRTAGGYAAEWRQPGKPGLYLVVARAAGMTAIKKVVLKP